MTNAARATYVVFGTLALLAGVVVFIAPSVLGLGADEGLTRHLLREQSAGFVFIGLMCLWAFRIPSARRPVHTALLVFTAMFAVIHWADYLGHGGDLWSPLANTIPSIILLITAPGAKASERA